MQLKSSQVCQELRITQTLEYMGLWNALNQAFIVRGMADVLFLRIVFVDFVKRFCIRGIKLYISIYLLNVGKATFMATKRAGGS